MTHLPPVPALVLLDLDDATPVPWTSSRDDANASALEPLFPASAPGRAVTAAQLDALLASARHEGFLAGVENGRRAAETTREARVAEALAQLAAATAASVRAAEGVMEGAAQAVADAVLAALRSALPSLAASLGAAEAAHFAGRIAEALREEMRIEIAVAPDLVEPVAARLAAHPRVAVVADGRLAPGDVTVEWKDGIAEHRAITARMLVLEALAVLAAPDKQAQE